MFNSCLKTPSTFGNPSECCLPQSEKRKSEGTCAVVEDHSLYKSLTRTDNMPATR